MALRDNRNQPSENAANTGDHVDIELGLRQEVTSVRQWLDQLHMSQYLPNFEDNAVSVQVGARTNEHTNNWTNACARVCAWPCVV